MKPRIAILHYTAPPIVGGVENVIAAHARLLRQAGYPVTLVAGRSSKEEAWAGESIILIPELDSRDPRNLEISQSLERGVVPAGFEALEQSIQDGLSPIVDGSDILIVHNAFNYHFNMPLTAALHRMLDRNQLGHLVAWCHDISRYVNPVSGAQQRFGFPWDLLRTYRPEVTYVAVSQRRRRWLADVLECDVARIQVISNGVDPNMLLGLSDFGSKLADDLRLTEADLIMLMPVRITLAKNIDYALRVAAAVRDAGAHVKLVVTGPPDPHSTEIQKYFARLLDLRSELHLDDEVVFVFQGTADKPGPLVLDAETVGELYRVCDLVLMASLREGFGLPILEGGLLAKPVFCTEVPVLEDVGGDSVFLIERDEMPAHVGERILAWAKDDRLQRLRRRVRQEYTWPAILQRGIEPLLAACMEEAAIPR